MKPLENKIALVAGATRGAGRGIACMLGELGATVICTGRSVRGRPATGTRTETIEETAEMVTSYGGVGHYHQADHTDEDQVIALFNRVRADFGRLDILINDIWGGDALSEWEKPFWELDLNKGRAMLERAIFTHIITARHGAPLMIEQNQCLIVEITDGDHTGYRGTLFYDLSKMGTIRLAYDMAQDLKPYNITALAVTPGFLRSEEMLDHFGVTEENWQDGTKTDPHFIASETPYFVGRAIAALAADPNVHQKAGQVWASWTLAREYGFKDIDGRQPDWGAHYDNIIKPQTAG
jgi:NAD(P)-dependent dehydrogenase (short-subunit alcohol dehydrogenase family)